MKSFNQYLKFKLREATDDTGTVASYPFSQYQQQIQAYLKQIQDMEQTAKQMYDATKDDLALELLKKIQQIGSPLVAMSDARSYVGHKLARNPNLKSWQ